MEGTRTLIHGPYGYGERSLTRARKIRELEILGVVTLDMSSS